MVKHCSLAHILGPWLKSHAPTVNTSQSAHKVGVFYLMFHPSGPYPMHTEFGVDTLILGKVLLCQKNKLSRRSDGGVLNVTNLYRPTLTASALRTSHHASSSSYTTPRLPTGAAMPSVGLLK